MSKHPPWANRNAVAWQELARPFAGGIRCVALDGGALVVETDEAIARSADEGATWTSAPAPPRRPPGEGAVVEALAPDGTRWRSLERHDIVFYPGGPGPRPILHAGYPITRAIERSADGGRTWTKERDDLSASAFVFDARGRTWVAGSSGLWRRDERGWSRLHDQPATGVVVEGERVVVAGYRSWLSLDGGASFAELAEECHEHGPWGLLEARAVDLQSLARGPDGAAWALARGRSHDGVFRLPPAGDRWQSLNLGLHVIPRVGGRASSLSLASLCVTPAGSAFVGGAGGLFRRAAG